MPPSAAVERRDGHRGRCAITTGSPRCGAAARGVGELRRELAEDRVLAALARSARTWRRPRTPWSRRCRARSPIRRAGRTGRASPLRTEPTRFFTGAWRCDVPRMLLLARPSASTCSGRTFDGPQPNRPSEGSSSVGMVMLVGSTMRSVPVTRPVWRIDPLRGARNRMQTPRAAATVRLLAREPHSASTGERPSRHHRRIGHPGGRRQGQGAEGAGRERHRLRCRRAGLPDAGAHRRGCRACLQQPGDAPLHAGRRPARAARGDRRQDEARLRVRVHGEPGARHQRRQARSVHRLRRAVRSRATR